MKHQRLILIAFILLFTGSFLLETKASVDGDKDKMNLEPVTADRFPLSGPDWPAEPGQASVCLWHMDKMAAASITIDDNIESEHEWWQTMHWIYNLDFTWFIILNSVSSWDKYQALIDAGNEVQGHDNCNINEYDTALYRGELEYTKLQINNQLADNNCLTYAYPCGDQSKQDIARSIYISIRGVTGLLNHANRTNYLDLNSRSATNDIHDIRVLLDPSETLWNNSYYRGWASYHYHSISSKKAETEAFLSALSAKTDSIWVGKYSEVARYAQERDSHSLTVSESGDSIIKFTLTDEMKDEFFDFPLTVKIRIDNSWGHIYASQDNSSIEAEIVEFQNNKYALVQAVPDKGEVLLSVSEENTPPSITIIEDQLVSEGFTQIVAIEASDAENDPILLRVDNLPAFGMFSDFGDGTGEISFSPMAGDAGTYENIALWASDGQDSSSIAFSLEVGKVSGIIPNSTQGTLSIFPNPASEGSFTIVSEEVNMEKCSSLDIISSKGEYLEYEATILYGNNVSIDLADNYSPGLVVLRLITNGKTIVQKILIN